MIDRLAKLISEYCGKNNIDYRAYAALVGVSAMEIGAIMSKMMKENDLKLKTVNKILGFHGLSLGIVVKEL